MTGEQADAPDQNRDRPGGETRRVSLAWMFIALLVFGTALVSVFGEFLASDLSQFVPSSRPVDGRHYQRGLSDHRFTVWAVSRNARTLLEQPSSLFDAEQCFPGKDSLAFGEPVITLGIVGTPAWLLTGDPIATYNGVVLFIGLFSAIAMYLLVTSWTRVPAAGIVAGLIYAFGPSKLGDLGHYFIDDTVWTVLALLFVQRLFAHGRWRDAIGLGLCCALQVGTSVYPVLSALAIALPVTVWLSIRHGLTRRTAVRLAVVGVMAGVAAAVVFGPAFEMGGSGELFSRRFQHHLPWSALLPGEPGFLGWLALGLGLLGLLLGRRRSLVDEVGDPRWALLVAGGLVLLFATGGDPPPRFPAGSDRSPLPVPNLFALLGQLVPVLQAVRAPMRIASGFYLCASILAGVGVAAVVRSIPLRGQTAAAIGLVLVTYVEALRPSALGLDPPLRIHPVSLRPADDRLRFFERLEEAGNRGPLLELPTLPMYAVADRLLLTAYHGRRTSACYNSFVPSVVERTVELAKAVPDPAATLELYDLGFRTIVLHPQGRGLRAKLRQAATADDPVIRPLLDDGEIAAFEILPPSGSF